MDLHVVAGDLVPAVVRGRSPGDLGGSATGRRGAHRAGRAREIRHGCPGTSHGGAEGVLFQDMFIACPATCLSPERPTVRCMSKQRVIVEAVLAGKSQREVARLYGVSQPRVSQLVAAWRAGGWDALEPKSRRPRSSPNATPPEVVARVLALRARAGRRRLRRRPPLDRRDPGRRDGRPAGRDDDLADPDPRRGDHPRAAQAAQALVDPVRGRPAERVLAGRLHPRHPRHRPRRRGPALGRRPLPVPDLRDRPRPRHRPHRRRRLPRRLRDPRHPAIHVDRQRIRVHHPPPQRPQRLRDRAAQPRRRAEERHPQPPPDPGQGRTPQPDPQAMAAGPARRAEPFPPCKHCSTSSPTTTTTGASTAP